MNVGESRGTLQVKKKSTKQDILSLLSKDFQGGPQRRDMVPPSSEGRIVRERGNGMRKIKRIWQISRVRHTDTERGTITDRFPDK